MADFAHLETDKKLAVLEKRLSAEYKQASKEVKEKLDDFLAEFEKEDKIKLAQLKNGEINGKQYGAWRKQQILLKNKWQATADSLAKDLTRTNEIAAKMINGEIPDIFALNYNFGTYEIESGLGINTSFTLVDRDAFELLASKNPDLLPKATIDIAKDLRWNKQQLNSAMLQGILQGESIPKLAQRVAKTVGENNEAAAIRNARTMTTSAENAGRINSYKRAKDMGIEMRQIWVAALDGRTRHEHRILDGQSRAVGEPFEVEGYEIEYPGDPKAEPFLVYNCRCTLIADVKGSTISEHLEERKERDLKDMTYKEWEQSKPTPKKQKEKKGD